MIPENRSYWTVRHIALMRLRQCARRPFVTMVDGPVETYGDFISHSTQLASALARLGVRKGDMVALLCRNHLPHLHAWLACALTGAVEVPINPYLQVDQLRHIVALTGPRVAVVDGSAMAELATVGESLGCLSDLIVVGRKPGKTSTSVRLHDYEALLQGSDALPDVAVQPCDLASVMFTSGTTGPAKGVMIPHGQLCLLAHLTIRGMRMDETDVFYCAHPLHHMAGKYNGAFAAFASGGQVILDQRFEATQWLQRIRKYGATVSIAHGPMIEMIHAIAPTSCDRDHRLRRMMCGPLPKHLASAFEDRFALRGVDMWGMTEVPTPIWASLDGPRVEGSCGRPVREWFEVQVADPDTDEPLPPFQTGEILVRARYPWTLMQGYLGTPEETRKAWRNLWFHTGDAGYFDRAGNLFFVDRLNDRIRRRAECISAYDIEVSAVAFAGVREAAAVRVPSQFDGDDDIKLCVVLHTGADFNPAELIKFLVGRLPHFMVPRYLEVVDMLPRTPTNKVRKSDLTARGISDATWDRQQAGIRIRELASSCATNAA